MNYSKRIFQLLLLCSGLLIAESFVLAPKKKQPRISAQDCCQQILREMQSFARINQYSGQIQDIELSWTQDFFDDEKNGLFNCATQEQLQKYMAHKHASNDAREEYEKALAQERNFLKQLEQEVFASKKKK